MSSERTYWSSRERQVVEQRDALYEVLKSLTAAGECFCAFKEEGYARHTLECKYALKALLAAEGDKLWPVYISWPVDISTFEDRKPPRRDNA